MTVSACPNCSESIEVGAKVCRHCLTIIDRQGWQHDAGRLGADGRGAGKPLEDPPVGPLPVTGSGLEGGTDGAAIAGFRLVTANLLARVRRRR